MKSPTRRRVIAGLVVVVGLGLLWAAGSAWLPRIEPPKRGTNFREFLEWQNGDLRFWQTTRGGMLMVTMKYWDRDAPAAYVFDRSGEIVDWTRSLSDSFASGARWSYAEGEMSKESAAMWFERK